MKKPCSPHRQSSPYPTSNIPYTVGFYDFLKQDRMTATTKTGLLHRPESKRPLQKVLDLGKSPFCSKQPTKSSPNKPKLEEDSWIATVRHIVREEIEFSKVRSNREGTGAPAGELGKADRASDLEELNRQIWDLSKRLETEKEDRVKIIQGMWVCFNQKIDDAAKGIKEGFSLASNQEEGKIKSIAEEIASTFSNQIIKLQSQIVLYNKGLEEAIRDVKDQVSAAKNERNSQLEVVITSIEHFNERMNNVQGTLQKFNRLEKRLEESQNNQKLKVVEEKMNKLSEFVNIIVQNQKQQVKNTSNSIEEHIQPLKLAIDINQSKSLKQFQNFKTFISETKQKFSKQALNLRNSIDKAKIQIEESTKAQFQQAETDKLNIKSRLKKLQNALKDNSYSNEAISKLEETFAEKLQQMTTFYNQNFKYFDTTQKDLCQTVKQSISLINSLTQRITDANSSTAQTLINSFIDLASHRSDLNEARLQKQIDSIRKSMTTFQAESKKHIQKVGCKDFSKDRRPLKFCSKSEQDVVNNCSSNQSIGSEVKLKTNETIETIDSAALPLE